MECLFKQGGAPNRPLPPTPDEEESGDRTLVMKRVSNKATFMLVNDPWIIIMCRRFLKFLIQYLLFFVLISFTPKDSKINNKRVKNEIKNKHFHYN